MQTDVLGGFVIGVVFTVWILWFAREIKSGRLETKKRRIRRFHEETDRLEKACEVGKYSPVPKAIEDIDKVLNEADEKEKELQRDQDRKEYRKRLKWAVEEKRRRSTMHGETCACKGCELLEARIQADMAILQTLTIPDLITWARTPESGWAGPPGEIGPRGTPSSQRTCDPCDSRSCAPCDSLYPVARYGPEGKRVWDYNC